MVVYLCVKDMGLRQAGKVVPMTDYCAFSKDHKCINWSDYELTRFELEEANELCHDNWVEIEHQQDYIELLQSILKQNGIDIPLEY
ncbi:MAG: mobility-associated LCxxNW protein [Clostridium sp.]